MKKKSREFAVNWLSIEHLKNRKPRPFFIFPPLPSAFSAVNRIWWEATNKVNTHKRSGSHRLKNLSEESRVQIKMKKTIAEILKKFIASPIVRL